MNNKAFFGLNKSVFSLKAHNKLQKFIHSDVRLSVTKKILATVASIFCAFMLAMIIACSVCQTWPKFGQIIKSIFVSGFQSDTFLNSLFSNMSILIVGGLAFIFAYKAGLFNIGISGQMVAGATGATLICHLAGLGQGANQFVVIIVSMAIGALVAALIGTLKAFLKVNEVVSSIMFNWIIYFMSILLLASVPIKHDASELNTLAPPDEILLRIGGNSWLPLLIIAIVSIIIVTVILNLTVFGKKQKVTGLSNSGALAAGYNVKANMISAMAISGAISGLLGAMIYCGFSPNMPITAAAKVIPQDGFNGISVGLISMCNPFASIPVSLFFSMVKTSVSSLQMLGIDNHIGDVVFGIVVYGAAAIALFLNIKPYWLTVGIFRGKNYSKIKHERNMTNVELISLSTDQCAVLHKYYVYYQKQLKVPSTYKVSPGVKIRMFIGGVRYWFTQKYANYRVWRNLEYDLMTNQKFYKQEMVHLVKDRHTGQLIADLKRKRYGGWYIKVTEETLNDSKLKARLKNITGLTPSASIVNSLKEAYDYFQAKPFNSHGIRLVAKLAYLQNLRSGLIYRNLIAKHNKLTYFTLMQTKDQAESIGLAEINSKKQYNFARTAYFKAYQKTFDIVKAHYDTMVKTFTRDKQLNVIGIRFDSATLEKIYIQNLKSEIKAISHLINCPLTKAQLADVGALVSKSRYLQSRIDTGMRQAHSYREMAQPYFEKAKRLNERGSRLHAQLKATAKLIGRMSDCNLSELETQEIHNLISRSAAINENITEIKDQAENAKMVAEGYIMKSKDVNDSVTTDKIAQQQVNNKVESIVDRARMTAKVEQTDKWTLQRLANEKAERILRKIAMKQAKKTSMKGGE